MNKEDAYQLAKQTFALYEESRLKPFPYAGTRELLRRYPDKCEMLIPDLDWFDFAIAGFSSRAEQVLDWTASEIQQAKPMLARSFYEKYPVYEPLRAKAGDLADLHADLEIHEKMRQSLLLLLTYRSHLLSQS